MNIALKFDCTCIYKDFQQKVTCLPSYLSQLQQLFSDKSLCCQGKTEMGKTMNDLFTMSTLIRSEKCDILFIFLKSIYDAFVDHLNVYVGI